MKGWEIFMHSVRLVFSNLQEAFKISAVPYAISAVAYIFLGSKLFSKLESTAPNQLMQEAQSISFGFFVYGVIAMLTFLWIAVSWHRYILLGEKPTGWVPAFHGSEIVNYFVKGILLFLLIFVVIFVVSLVLALLLFWMGPAGALFVGFIAAGVSYYVFYRLCPVLPAAAVGRPMTMGEAWNATAGNGTTIFVLVVVLIGFSILVQLPNYIGGAYSMIGVIYTLVVGWFMMLISASILTTFYGHFIEGRAIEDGTSDKQDGPSNET